MFQFLKAQASSLLASATDFGVTILLKELGLLLPIYAAILGTVSGGIVNFTINRYWVFRKQSSSLRVQIGKYVMVWWGNLLLNSLGNWLLLTFTSFHYMLIKVSVSLLVGFLYNYFLQKKFVFK